MNPWSRVLALARTQHGVVSAAQARECGIPEATWYRRIRRENWPQLQRGVVASPSARITFEAEIMAALLSVGPPAFASHWTAAHLLRIRTGNPPATLDVIVPDRRNRAALAGALRPLVIAGVQSGRCRLDRIAALLDGPGRLPGQPLLRQVLAQLAVDRCDSELEYLVRQALRREGFDPAPDPVPVRLPDGRTIFVDIGLPPLPVGIEVDGRAYHTSAEDVSKDHRRQNAIVAVNYRLLRITWLRFDQDWPGFVKELRWNLEAATAFRG